MNKITRKFFLNIFILTLAFFIFAPKAEAEGVRCPYALDPSPPLYAGLESLVFEFEITEEVEREIAKYPSGGILRFSFPGTVCKRQDAKIVDRGGKKLAQYTAGGGSWSQCDNQLFDVDQINQFELIYDYPGSRPLQRIQRRVCQSENFEILPQQTSCDVSVTPYSGDVNETFIIEIKNFQNFPKYYNGLQISYDSGAVVSMVTRDNVVKGEIPAQLMIAGTHHVEVSGARSAVIKRHVLEPCGSADFVIVRAGETPVPSPTPAPPTPTPDPKCQDIIKAGEDPCQYEECQSLPQCQEKAGGIKAYNICEQIPEFEEQSLCLECFREGGAWSAMGCIPTNSANLVSFFLGPLIGLSGGIAFLLILKGGFAVLFSGGDPEKVAGGQETITAALLGLLIIIFSIFILKIIGVDIFVLPGFSG